MWFIAIVDSPDTLSTTSTLGYVTEQANVWDKNIPEAHRLTTQWNVSIWAVKNSRQIEWHWPCYTQRHTIIIIICLWLIWDYTAHKLKYWLSVSRFVKSSTS